MTFAFDRDTRTVQWPSVVDKKPENLKASWDTRVNTELFSYPINARILTFDLLNPGDEITAEFLCTGKVALPKVTARIEGISEIGVLDPEELRLREQVARNTGPALFGSAMMLVLFGVSVYRVWKGNVPVENLRSLAITVAFFVMFLWSISLVRAVRLARYRRRKRES